MAEARKPGGCWAGWSWFDASASSDCLVFLWRPNRQEQSKQDLSKERKRPAPIIIRDKSKSLGPAAAAAARYYPDSAAVLSPARTPGGTQKHVRFAGHNGSDEPPSLQPLGEACEQAASRRATLVRRAATVTCYLLPPVTRALSDYIRNRKRGGVPKERAVAHATRARVALQDLGPAFVKMGQALAAREDVLSPEVALELRKLCDQVPPFPVEEARALLEEELGASAPAIDGKAIAAASLGQVYRVNIGGIDYAVKVQRPGLAGALAVDVVILRGLARYLRKVASLFCTGNLDLVRIVDSWALTLWHELDYVREAASMDKMRDELLGKVKGLVIPEVHWKLTSLRVLTTEWIHGRKVTDGGVSDRHIAVGVEAFAAMILEVGFVHADPHAGNMIITNGNDMCLLDFGMVVEVPESHRRAWAECICSLVCGDHGGTLDSLIKIGFFPADCPRATILPVMSRIWTELVASGSDTKKRKAAVMKCYDEILTLVREFQFDLPDYYIVLVRALLTLEGIALASDCQFDIFKAAFPVARRSLVSSLSSSQSRRDAAGMVLGAVSRGCRRRASSSSGPSWRSLVPLAGIVGLLAAATAVASTTGAP